MKWGEVLMTDSSVSPLYRCSYVEQRRITQYWRYKLLCFNLHSRLRLTSHHRKAWSEPLPRQCQSWNLDRKRINQYGYRYNHTHLSLACLYFLLLLMNRHLASSWQAILRFSVISSDITFNHVIFLTEFFSNTNPKWPVIVAFLNCAGV